MPSWMLNAVAWLLSLTGLAVVFVLAMGLLIQSCSRVADRAGWLWDFFDYQQRRARDKKRKGHAS